MPRHTWTQRSGGFALGALLLAACVQPMRLARNDAPTVLAHQRILAPNPAEPGTFPVHTLYYGSGTDRHRPEYRDSVTFKTKAVDGSKLATATADRKKYWGFGFEAMPLNGRVWYPEGAGPFPLILIVHGNHDMKDFSDPGYGYLGELFASRGYIFVSVDENFLNGAISGENDARGWLLLEHLKAWRGFNDSIGSPFQGRVDMDRIALMGHSRGGEAVAVAALFNRLSRYPDNALVTFDFGFAIRSLVAIAPVDGQYQPTSRPTPVENVNYLVLHGSHDGDVSNFQGLKQYARIRYTDSVPRFKSAIWMYRANHGQWNTGWGARDAGPLSARSLDLRGLLPGDEQQRMAKVFLSAFIDATLRDRQEYLPIFQDHRTIGAWLPKTMYATRFQDAGFRALADFDEDVDLTTGSASGVRLQGDSLATWREAPMPLRSRGATVGKQAVWLGWNRRIAGPDTTRLGTPASYQVTIPDSLGRAWAVNAATALQFSLTPTDEKPAARPAPKDTTRAPRDSTARDTTARRPAAAPRPTPPVPDSTPVDLTIEAVDAAGRTVRLPLTRYGAARRPLEVTIYRRRGTDRTNFGNLAELVPQTYVIPLRDFVAADSLFDPSRLTAIRWVFDRTVLGTVILADIGLSNLTTPFLIPEEK